MQHRKVGLPLKSPLGYHRDSRGVARHCSGYGVSIHAVPKSLQRAGLDTGSGFSHQVGFSVPDYVRISSCNPSRTVRVHPRRRCKIGGEAGVSSRWPWLVASYSPAGATPRDTLRCFVFRLFSRVE